MIGRIATARGRRAAREFAEFAVRFLPVSPAIPAERADPDPSSLIAFGELFSATGHRLAHPAMTIY